MSQVLIWLDVGLPVVALAVVVLAVVLPRRARSG